ncbi:MAG: hypothetical protein LBS89_06625 [Zoogloeaceae bacterium]|nr:hypothetical protein [Zoogloeaceae bacterium]
MNFVRWSYRKRFFCRLLPLFLAYGLLAGGAYGFSLADISLALTTDHIRHALFQIRQMQLRLEGTGGTLSLGQLDLMGQSWKGVHITCGRLQLESGRFRCEQGRLTLPGSAPMALTLRQEEQRWFLQLQPQAGEVWEVVYTAEGKQSRLRLDVKNGSPGFLVQLLPPLAAVKALNPVGRLSGRVEYAQQASGQHLTGQLTLTQGGYASADASQAAEALRLVLNLTGKEQQGQWQMTGSLDWTEGAFYSAPLFLNANGQRLEFAGSFGKNGWNLQQATLHWPEVGTLTAAGQGEGAAIQALRLTAPQVELSMLGAAVLQPVFEGKGWPKIALSGQVGLEATWRQGALAQLAVSPKNAGLVLEEGRLALEGLEGQLAWQSGGEEAQTSALQVSRLALGRLESGAFRLPLALWPRSFALAEPVTIPLLDGELVVNHLAAGYAPETGEWEGALGLSLHPMSLEKLTAVLDMPTMRGSLSADLPTIRYEKREAALDGALVIQVFDGYLFCHDLHFIDPFGTRPRILADVETRHLDLEQLTQTFSFGQMTGFVDASLEGLELAAWRPQAVNARIASSPGKYPRRISQKAVDNITSLGGGGAVAAIQSSFLRFFQDFGYRRIGLACRLENGVCHMSGIEGLDKDERYAIIEGGGIPALTVMGYNRRVNWEEFVARLKAAIHSSAAPVVQ